LTKVPVWRRSTVWEDNIKVAVRRTIMNPTTLTWTNPKLALRHPYNRNNPREWQRDGKRGGGGVWGNSPDPPTSPSPFSPSPASFSTTTFTTTAIPAPPRSTVTIVTVVPAPTSSTTTLPQLPEAICTAYAKIQNVEVDIWTNYITANGAALQNQAQRKCAAHILPSGASRTVQSPTLQQMVPPGLFSAHIGSYALAADCLSRRSYRSCRKSESYTKLQLCPIAESAEETRKIGKWN